MHSEHPADTAPPAPSSTPASAAPKAAYESPRVVRRQSLARVTLFSGGGTSTVGLVTSG